MTEAEQERLGLWVDLPECAKSDDERARENIAAFADAIEALAHKQPTQ